MPPQQAQPDSSTVTIELPSGEPIDVQGPAGMTEQQAQDLARKRYPEEFQAEAPAEAPPATAKPDQGAPPPATKPDQPKPPALKTPGEQLRSRGNEAWESVKQKFLDWGAAPQGLANDVISGMIENPPWQHIDPKTGKPAPSWGDVLSQHFWRTPAGQNRFVQGMGAGPSADYPIPGQGIVHDIRARNWPGALGRATSSLGLIGAAVMGGRGAGGSEAAFEPDIISPVRGAPTGVPVDERPPIIIEGQTVQQANRPVQRGPAPGGYEAPGPVGYRPRSEAPSQRVILPAEPAERIPISFGGEPTVPQPGTGLYSRAPGDIEPEIISPARAERFTAGPPGTRGVRVLGRREGLMLKPQPRPIVPAEPATRPPAFGPRPAAPAPRPIVPMEPPPAGPPPFGPRPAPGPEPRDPLSQPADYFVQQGSSPKPVIERTDVPAGTQVPITPAEQQAILDRMLEAVGEKPFQEARAQTAKPIKTRRRK